MAKADAWVMIPVAESDGKECSLDIYPLVLCKNCKHGEVHADSLYRCAYHFQIGLHEPDWFCADGEKRDEDTDDQEADS